jgi:hypothetical protein
VITSKVRKTKMTNLRTLAALMAGAMMIGPALAAEATCSGTEALKALQGIIDEHVTKPYNASLMSDLKVILTQAGLRGFVSLPPYPKGQGAPGEITLEEVKAALARTFLPGPNSLERYYTPIDPKPESIITVQSNDRAASCKAVLAYATIQNRFQYTVETTDDDKLYITAYNLRLY